MPQTSSPSPNPADGHGPWSTTMGSWFGGPALTDLAWPDDETGASPTHNYSEMGDAPPWSSGSPEDGEISKDASTHTFFRIYRAFLTARAALGITLFGILIGATLLGSQPTWWMLGLTALYGSATLIWWGLPSQRSVQAPSQHTLKTSQSLATVGVDLVAFALLHYVAGSTLKLC